MSSSLLCIMFILFSLFAEAKFSRGDNFQLSNIDGSLTIVCKNKTKNVTCRDVFMDPWPYDVFLGPKNSYADTIEFDSINNGEIQNSVAKYHGQTGRSDDVNLGVFSIFQKPLLRVGDNRIRYSILDRSGKVVDTDIFSVNVTRGRSRTCATRQTVTENAEDCDHTYSLCQIYFKNQNFCR